MDNGDHNGMPRGQSSLYLRGGWPRRDGVLVPWLKRARRLRCFFCCAVVEFGAAALKLASDYGRIRKLWQLPQVA